MPDASNAPVFKYTIGPYAILTFIYFIVGFLTTVNGQFQGPLQIAFLSKAVILRNTLTTLISFFFFLGYLVNSSVAGNWIDAKGYKVTLIRSLFIMVTGLLLYCLAAWTGDIFPETGIFIKTDFVPLAYFIFLFGCFVMGTSAAMLQVVINPYVSSYKLPGTSAVQRMNITTGINSIGTTIGPFFVTAVIFAGVAVSAVRPAQLLSPILWIAAIVFIVTIVTIKLPLPDLTETRSNLPLPRSVWSFSHLTLGVLAIFVYVGAEVGIGVNINMHALQMIETGNPISFLGKDTLVVGGINLGIPALLATFYWGGMMVGRLVSSAFPKVPPKPLLITVTSIATFMILIAMIFDNLYVLSAVGLCHSVMWGCIFTLAIAGLGPYTSRASGVFMMGVFGGAVFPLFQGMLADSLGSWRWTWFLILFCELGMLLYGLRGCRVKDAEALERLNTPGDPG